MYILYCRANRSAYSYSKLQLYLSHTVTAGSSFENNSYPKLIITTFHSSPDDFKHGSERLSTSWIQWKLVWKKILKNAKNEKLKFAFSSLSCSDNQKTFEGRLIVYQNSFQIQDWYNIQRDNWFLRSLKSLASRCARLTESLTTLANSPSIALRSFSPRLQN